MTAHVPDPPTGAPVMLVREAARLLSLVDLNTNAHRLLWLLFAQKDDATGIARISQAEAGAALGMTAPSVHRAFVELTDTGIIRMLQRARYQINPALTGGKTAGPLAEVPLIKARDPETFSRQRRARYQRNLQNLSLSKGA